MKYIILATQLSFLFFSVFTFSQSVSTPVRTVSKVNDGVYVVRHRDAPDGNPQGNTSIIIGEKKVIVVAHEETAGEMVGFEDKDLVRYRQGVDSLKTEVKSGKNNKGEVLTQSEMKDAKELYSGQDSVERELENYKPCYPNLTITGNLNLDIGNEIVQVLCRGMANF